MKATTYIISLEVIDGGACVLHESVEFFTLEKALAKFKRMDLVKSYESMGRHYGELAMRDKVLVKELHKRHHVFGEIHHAIKDSKKSIWVEKFSMDY